MASRRRGWLWLFVGFVFALIAAFIAMAVVELRVQQSVSVAEPAGQKEAAEAEPVGPVVVAMTHIAPTEPIESGDVTLQEWPVDIIPEGAATDIEEVIGKITTADIYAGEAILTLRLADPDITSEHVAFTMDEDKVIFALPPDDLMSQIHLLKAGDLVDILFSLEPEQKAQATPEAGQGEESVIGEGLFTTDALQSQRITAIVVRVPETLPTQAGEEVVSAGPAEPEAILLALDPQDALVLKYFRDAGGIMDIVLRHPSNEKLFELHTVNLDYIKDLYGLPGEGLVPGE